MEVEMSNVGGVGYGTIENTLGQVVESAEGKLQNFMTTMDHNNPVDLTTFQVLSQEWHLTLTLSSNTIKLIGDALKEVANKIG
jgi:hypothetical protein